MWLALLGRSYLSDEARIQWVLDKLQPDVNEVLFSEPTHDVARSPLHLAANRRPPHSLQRVRILLEAGADPNVYCDELGTPLHSACRVNNTTAVSHLLAAGTDPATYDGDWQTAVHVAAALCESTTVNVILSVAEPLGCLPSILCLSDRTGRTPLLARMGDKVDFDKHEACKEMDACLVAAGAVRNGWGSDGSPSLALAVSTDATGCGELISSLLDTAVRELGRDLAADAVTQALWWAILAESNTAVETLWPATGALPAFIGGPMLMCLAAHRGSLAMVEQLLKCDPALATASEPIGSVRASEYAARSGCEAVIVLLEGKMEGGESDSEEAATPSTSGDDGDGAAPATCLTIPLDHAPNNSSGGDNGGGGVLAVLRYLQLPCLDLEQLLDGVTEVRDVTVSVKLLSANSCTAHSR